MTAEEMIKRVHALCRKTQEIDDALGRFSDYEGQQDGPTWYLWNSKSPRKYSMHVDYAIDQHSKAIATLMELRQLKLKQAAIKKAAKALSVKGRGSE